MPVKTSFLAIVAAITMLAACTGKEQSEVEPKRRFISFKMDGKVNLSEQSNRAYYTPGNTTDADPGNDQALMLITGYTYNRDVVNIRLSGTGPELKPGIYSNTIPGTLMAMEMYPSFELLTADKDYGTLTVQVLGMQDSVISASFSGSMVSLDDGSIRVISDGYFKMKYQQAP
ncbi:hypothetical protein ACFOTA_09765 [Chitinophaga sp. GCM10012297]|uniref:DUF4251 domain-containing protein n=1 Tax=Chitinophaga chungangae TaxID=2821488 RepID=A0ABS3YCV3_9BACT|nr:hypothetical protein [Chitinophaga chungangae]MBO9152491.1 hypothetical protein [Chitinophaga chungangae]